jgi:hypothetical protein
MFNDITALLLRPDVFKDAVDMFVERYRGMGIAAVAGKSSQPLTNHRSNSSSSRAPARAARGVATRCGGVPRDSVISLGQIVRAPFVSPRLVVRYDQLITTTYAVFFSPLLAPCSLGFKNSNKQQHHRHQLGTNTTRYTFPEQ